MTIPLDPPITSPVTIRDMARIAASVADIPLDDLLGPSRRDRLCRIRHGIWAMAFDRGFTLGQIARVFNRHHSTILHGIRMHRRRQGARDGAS